MRSLRCPSRQTRLSSDVLTRPSPLPLAQSRVRPGGSTDQPSASHVLLRKLHEAGLLARPLLLHRRARPDAGADADPAVALSLAYMVCCTQRVVRVRSERGIGFWWV
jgi:hypothetical protein